MCAIALISFRAQAFTLEDITSEKFRPHDVAETYPRPTTGCTTTPPPTATPALSSASTAPATRSTPLFDVKTARECNLKSFDGFSLSPDEKHLLIYADSEPIYRRSFKATYYTFEIRRNLLKPLSEGGKQQVAVYSPNGRMVAFVRDNNIYIKKLDYGTEVAVTRDGQRNQIINGVPDWVYEEEFAMTSTLQWSPNDETLAFVKFDESQVPMYAFQLYEGYCPAYPEYRFYPGSFTYKYPVAGETNSRVSVYSYTVDTRALKEMKLPISADSYIPRIQFTPDPDRLAVVTLNRTQNEMDIYAVNPKSCRNCCCARPTRPGSTSPSSTTSPSTPTSSSWPVAAAATSTSTVYNYNGTLARQITRGEWNVSSFLGYDANSGSYFYESNQEGPLYKAIYKINAKGVETKLSTLKGTNTAVFNPSCTYFINRYSSSSEAAGGDGVRCPRQDAAHPRGQCGSQDLCGPEPTAGEGVFHTAPMRRANR